jgi:Beta/Gamma crystallin
MKAHLLAACLSFAIGLAACAGPPRPSITVYSKRAFRGDVATLRDGYADLGEDLPDFDREISSFEIEHGTWQVCRKTRFRNCRTADRSMDDLGGWDLDNAIRSLRPIED